MEHPRQALVFSVGKTRYAMDILHLREVGRMPKVEPAPDGPEWVVGMIRLHGKPVRVFDLGLMLHLTQGADLALVTEDRCWLIVSHDADGVAHWRVSSVEDIVDYTSSQVVASSSSGIPNVLDLSDGLAYMLTPHLLCATQPI